MTHGLQRLGAFALVVAAAACSSAKNDEPFEMASAKGVTFELHALQPPDGYDPFALARASAGHQWNQEPSTPPQCSTTGGLVAPGGFCR